MRLAKLALIVVMFQGAAPVQAQPAGGGTTMEGGLSGATPILRPRQEIRSGEETIRTIPGLRTQGGVNSTEMVGAPAITAVGAGERAFWARTNDARMLQRFGIDAELGAKMLSLNAISTAVSLENSVLSRSAIDLTASGGRQPPEVVFRENLLRSMPAWQIEQFGSERDLLLELTDRGFLRPGDDMIEFMIFDGDDITDYEEFLNQPPGGINAPGGLGGLPSLELVQRMGSATGMMYAPASAGAPFALADGELTFTDLEIYGLQHAGLPFCEGDPGGEPKLGTCSGVFADLGDGGRRFITAAHCVRTISQDVETFVIFDYLKENWDRTNNTFTSRHFARVDVGSIRTSDTLDIASMEIAFIAGAPPEAVVIDGGGDPAAEERVGSFGHPFGRPRKAIFGPGVSVKWAEPTRFGAFVDSFAVSSGSPIFAYDGELLGVLSYQEDPVDFVPAEDMSCVLEAVVSSLHFDPPIMVKAHVMR